jgi:hypothetical protein
LFDSHAAAQYEGLGDEDVSNNKSLRNKKILFTLQKY